jgi:hypothetical protein
MTFSKGNIGTFADIFSSTMGYLFREENLNLEEKKKPLTLTSLCALVASVQLTGLDGESLVLLL